MGIVGLTLTLAKEGQRKGIFLNCIAPNAFTEMTLGIIPQQFGEQVSVKQITPVVLFLASD